MHFFEDFINVNPELISFSFRFFSSILIRFLLGFTIFLFKFFPLFLNPSVLNEISGFDFRPDHKANIEIS